MKNITLYISFFLSLIISVAKAEISETNFDVQHLGTYDGLSSQRVFSIAEDKYKVIWIATKDGVDRYNGNSVKNYTLPGPFYNGDMGGRILRLFYDEQHGLWVYDQTGKVFKYSERNDKFILVYILEQMIPGPITLNKFYIDDQGSCLFGTQKGAYEKKVNDSIKCILQDKYITDIISLENTKVIASSQGVYHLKSDNTIDLNQLTEDLYVQSLYYDNTRQELWIGTFNDGLIILNMNTHKWDFIKYALDNRNPIRSITDYDHETMLIGVDGGGVYTINKDTYQSKLFMATNDNISRTRLLANGVYSILKDSQSNIWVGSYTGGVSVAILLSIPSTVMIHEFGNIHSLADNNINDIEENIDGNLWYSTDSGISICNQKTGKWKHILNNIVVTRLCQGENGSVWAGTYGKGVYKLDINGNIIDHLSVQNKELTTNYTLAVHYDSEGNLCIGGLGGKLVIINHKKKQRQLYDIDWVQSIQSVNDKILAVATTYGFYLINKSDGDIREYATSTKYKDQDASSYIISMLFNNDDTVWLGTEGGGLCLYNLLTDDVKKLTLNDGLPSNDIYSLHRDKKNRLWVSTGKGLAMIQNFHVSNFNYLGSVDKSFNKSSLCNMKNGNIVYGSTSGAVFLNPDNMESTDYNSPVRITGMQIKNIFPEQTDSIFPEIYDMINNNHVKLKYRYNSFSATYESVNYCYRRDIVYQHILEGYDKSWSDQTNNGVAQYTNVLAGSYKFKVRSLRSSDGKIISESEILIDIAQPWWNSVYAWMIYLTMLLCVFYLMLRYKSNQMQKKYDKEKLNYFINTAHDIRTPVTLIMAPLEDLSKEKSLSPDAFHLLDLARNNTNKLYTLVTRLLEFEKVETYKEQFTFTTLCLNSVLAGEAVCFQDYCDRKHQQLILKMPEDDIFIKADKYMLEMLLDNLISNACKYTPSEGTIELRLTTRKNSAILEVADNGIGIPVEARRHLLKRAYRAKNARISETDGNGFGLLQVQRIVSALHGKISYQSEEGKGTTFKVTLDCTNDKKDMITVSEEIVKDPLINDNYTVSSAKRSIETMNLENCNDKDTLLIVEDNESLRDYLCSIFDKDYRVINKPDAQAALEYMAEEYPDLILSDVMMPGIQGDELCHRIKSDPETEGIPFILLTAKVNHDAVVSGLKNGADDYIPKPFSTEILKLKVQGLLENRNRLRSYLMRQSLQQVQKIHKDSLAEERNPEISDDVAITEQNNQLQPNVEISESDREFVSQATRIVMDNLDNTEFTINILCQNMGMSRTLFFSRLKSLTGKAPQEFIRIIRLQKSVELLRSGMSVNDVAAETGFINTKYFSTLFKKEFGVQPSKFV